MSDEVHRTEGKVRRVTIDDTGAAGTYAAITIASDPAYYRDFDDPEFWEGRRGEWVCINWVVSTNTRTGLTYRRVVDAWNPDEENLG